MCADEYADGLLRGQEWGTYAQGDRRECLGDAHLHRTYPPRPDGEYHRPDRRAGDDLCLRLPLGYRLLDPHHPRLTHHLLNDGSEEQRLPAPLSTSSRGDEW